MAAVMASKDLNDVAMEDEGLKRCKSCGRMLPLSMFTKAKTCTDGLSPQCKDCVSKYNHTKYYSANGNLAFDRIPWPYNDDRHEMDMEAIAEYKREKQLQR